MFSLAGLNFVAQCIPLSMTIFFVAVTKIKFAKAVINEIGAGAEGVFKLAGVCCQIIDKPICQSSLRTF